MASLKNTTINDTGFIQLPSGTTAQRPAGVNGMMRYNTTLAAIEIYNGATSSWNTLISGGYTVDVLIAAGGGGGGAGGTIWYGGGGGGGAGGLRVISNISVATNTAYPIVIGAGGCGSQTNSQGTIYWGSNGGNSSAFGYTSTGGGHGGSFNGEGPYWYGQDGGSGGGAGRDKTSGNGAGIAGQGYSGATAYAGGYASAGGGGGAGGAGYQGGADGQGQYVSGLQAAGGIGLAYNWTGTNIYYCGGGGGSWSSPVGGVGGVGGAGYNDGGGNGSGSLSIGGTAGLANRGQGGGGAHSNKGDNGGYGSTGFAGGSGVVLIRYLGPPKAKGGIITQYNGYTCHQFNGSGNFIA
jgi:hypothetical protein